GRIKHHIKNNIGDPNSTILLVGYASANTLAGALKRGDRQVNIFGEHFDVKCRVETMDSFSGHGDYNEMLDFLSCQTPGRVKEVFLVHGEYETQVAFKLKLEKAGYGKIHIPALYEGVKI